MIWTVLLSLHLVGLVAYTILLRKSALSSVNKYALAAIMQTAIQVPAITFIFLGKVSFSYSPIEWITLLGSSIFLVGVHLLSIAALKHLEASQWTIIFNLRLFLTTIFGYLFLHELPSSLQLVGGFIIFVSIVLLNLHKNKAWKEKPILIGLFTTLWFSAHATLEKYNVVSIGFEDYMVVAGLISTALLWGIAVKKGVNRKLIRQTVDLHTLRLLFFRALSAWAYVYALKFGSLAVTNYVSGMSVVVIVVLGITVLHENKYLRQKIIATTTAIIGLTLILISKLQ